MKAMVQEIEMQRHYLGDEQIETIYFGGGTPSLLNDAELGELMTAIQDQFSIHHEA